MAGRRLQTDLRDLNKSETINRIKELKVSDENINVWNMKILPSEVPYSQHAFEIQVDFPSTLIQSR